jgi:hypothetical protein
MISAEHRKPLAALLVVFAAACLILANGLRADVAHVLVGSGPPREVTSAVVPDMVLGQSLHHAPAPATEKKSSPAAQGARAPQAPTLAVAASVSRTTTATITSPRHLAAAHSRTAQPRSGHTRTVRHHATKPVTKPASHAASAHTPTQAAPAADPVAGASPKPVPAKGSGPVTGTSVVTAPIRVAFASVRTSLTIGNATGHGPAGGWKHHVRQSHPTWHPTQHLTWHPTQHPVGGPRQRHLTPPAAPAPARSHRHVDPPRRARPVHGAPQTQNRGAGHRNHPRSGSWHSVLGDETRARGHSSPHHGGKHHGSKHRPGHH